MLFLELARRFWYLFVMAAGVLALLALYGAAYRRALRPRAGTLEWIAAYDRPAFVIAGTWHSLQRRDALCLPLVCLAALGAWGFAAWQSYLAAFSQPAPVDAAIGAGIVYGVLPPAAAAAVYCLLQGLFACRPVSVTGALILALDLNADPEALLWTALVTLLLLRFLTAEGSPWALLALAFAAAAAGCYFQPALLVTAAGAVLLLLAGCLGRLVQTGRGRLWRSLLTAAAAFAVTTALVYLPAALLRGMTFPRVLFSTSYYRLIAARLAAGTAGLFGFRPMALLQAAAYDWLLLLLGLFGAAASLAALCRRRDYRGMAAALLFAVLAALWCLCGVYAMPLACVVGLGCVWSGLYRRGARLLFGAGAALPLALLLALYLTSWVLPR